MDSEFFHLVRRFLLTIVPRAAHELRRIKQRAQRIGDGDMRREALASIALKDFHVYGGCILATFLEPQAARHYIRLVAVFETAVDYLDNLCDRLGSSDEADFRVLHRSLLDAIQPRATLQSYFGRRVRDDGGYLAWLVRESQKLFAALPAYDRVAPYVQQVTQRYCELQALKHLLPGIREKRCRQAFAQVARDLNWWEGAAASGSTMPTFALAFAAARGAEDAQAREVFATYVPYISAFHILLDYFIDQAEDKAHGELNFVACYANAKQACDSIARIGREALAAAQRSSTPREHAFTVRAMCGFYCSRPKVAEQSLCDDASFIAEAVGVNIGARSWSADVNPLLAPLLQLYQRVIRV